MAAGEGGGRRVGAPGRVPFLGTAGQGCRTVPPQVLLPGQIFMPSAFFAAIFAVPTRPKRSIRIVR